MTSVNKLKDVVECCALSAKANPVFKKRIQFDKIYLGKEDETEDELLQELVEHVFILRKY